MCFCEGGTLSAVGELWVTDDERGWFGAPPGQVDWVPFRQLELRVSSLPRRPRSCS